jgi:quinolinate synthase
MQAEAIEFKQFDSLLDDNCEQRIVAAKAALGKRARKIVNQIKVPEAEAKLAKLALERMLEVS